MKNLKVIFLSEWLSNPYKDLLGKQLEVQGLQVREDLWKTFFIPSVLFPWKSDILHLHTLHPFLRGRFVITKLIKLCFFVAQVIFLRLMGVKTVWTVHEWADKLDTGSSQLSSNHAAIIGKVLFALITHCESTKNDIIRDFKLKNSQKVYVIPHGNYIGFYENKIAQSEAREHLNIPDKHLTFLIFGGLYRYKGILEALRAFKKLDASQVTLIIAGNPSEKGLQAEIEQEIQTCSKQIIFVPERIRDQDIQIYMNACDCVIVPYKVFTTSGVAILAMSFGRICIAPYMGFFQDIFNEGGAFLYDINHPEGLLKAMSISVENQLNISTMAQHNLALAKQWSWDYVASQTISVYTHN